MEKRYSIGVAGLWHLGEIYAAGLSELGHTVVGYDEDASVIDGLAKNIPPLKEPGLPELISKQQIAGALSFTNDPAGLSSCDVVWITPDTPVNERDEVDLSGVLGLVDRILPHLKDDVLLVISSQIPIGTSANVKARLRPGMRYAYSPENLRLGAALECFRNPVRVVVGADDASVHTELAEVLAPLEADIVPMSTASAEMTKHALNSFLATSMSFANDIADLSEEYGAEAETVLTALKSDPRIGAKAYLFAGLGFSGATLARDVQAHLSAAKERGRTVPVIEGVLTKNRSRSAVVPTKLAAALGDITGRTLALFGVTYKGGTSTLRRSQPLEIEKLLREKGAATVLYDANAGDAEVKTHTPAQLLRDPYEAAQGADAVLLMTPSPEFRELDWKKLKANMKGTLLFDTGNIAWNARNEIEMAGLTYLCIGQ